MHARFFGCPFGRKMGTHGYAKMIKSLFRTTPARFCSRICPDLPKLLDLFGRTQVELDLSSSKFGLASNFAGIGHIWTGVGQPRAELCQSPAEFDQHRPHLAEPRQIRPNLASASTKFGPLIRHHWAELGPNFGQTQLISDDFVPEWAEIGLVVRISPILLSPGVSRISAECAEFGPRRSTSVAAAQFGPKLGRCFPTKARLRGLAGRLRRRWRRGAGGVRHDPHGRLGAPCSALPAARERGVDPGLLSARAAALDGVERAE